MAVVAPYYVPAAPTTILGRPTMLDPTLFLGETLWTFGCTSVVPVPDIAPTGLFMKDDVLFVFVCRMLSTVFSMKTRLFFIVSPPAATPLPFCGEF